MMVHKKCSERNAPTVETQLKDTFKAALYKHINIALVAFILHPSPITLASLRTHTHSIDISVNHLPVQMSQSAPDASSHSSDLSIATQYMPNTGMHMGQFPWPQHAYIPCPGYASAHPYYPYSVSANEKNDAPPPYALVTPSSGIGAGVTHHAIQAGQDGCCSPPVADVSGVNPPPQHPSASPLYQPFPSIYFPGPANSYAPPIPHKGYLGLPPPSVPQAQNLSVGQKRVAEDLQARDAKRTKTGSRGVKNDPLFKPVLNRCGQPNGTFMCSKDGTILHPESYLTHIETKKHLGYKLERFKCPVCSRTYARLDNCKRHFYSGECGKSTTGGAPPSFSASPAFTSSAFAAPATAPTGSVTQSCGIPQTSETGMIAEAVEDDKDDDDPDFWEANEIQDAYEI